MDLPKRKRNRIADFDYSTPHAYFITICTQNRQNLFWTHVGAAIGRPQDVPLSKTGGILRQCIESISQHYSAVTVDHYVIMPNHVHLLLQINTDGNGRPMAAPTISTVVNQAKGIVTKQAGFTVWQKGFYDHVIRSEEDYLDTWNYIEGNPGKWSEDNLYKNF